MFNKISKTDYEKHLFDLEQEYEKKLEEQKERIVALREENVKLSGKVNSYSVKDESISRALVLAVEKAKELENSSKNLYDLEIQRIRILYSRWEQLLNMIIKKYPGVKTVNEINNLIEEFSTSITDTINNSFTINKNEEKVYVKTLLNRMNGYASSRGLGNNVVNDTKTMNETRRVKTSSIPKNEIGDTISNNNSMSRETNRPKMVMSSLNVESPSELNDLNNRQSKSLIKPISDINLKGDDKYESVLDKFLASNDGEEANTAYAKKIAPILNQRIEEKIEDYITQKDTVEGFDLSEAVRPKETLEEIMKAFDFYDNE